MEGGLHAWAGHGNTKAIEKCDDRERAQERQNAVSIAQERVTRIGFGELAGRRVRGWKRQAQSKRRETAFRPRGPWKPGREPPHPPASPIGSMLRKPCGHGYRYRPRSLFQTPRRTGFRSPRSADDVPPPS